MSLMYEVAAVNAAMIQAAEVCRQDMPEGEKVNAVLACFAGMKPVEAEPVVHAKLEYRLYPRVGIVSVHGEMRCRACGQVFQRITGMKRFKYCPNCSAKLDAREVEA